MIRNASCLVLFEEYRLCSRGPRHLSAGFCLAHFAKLCCWSCIRSDSACYSNSIYTFPQNPMYNTEISKSIKIISDVTDITNILSVTNTSVFLNATQMPCSLPCACLRQLGRRGQKPWFKSVQRNLVNTAIRYRIFPNFVASKSNIHILSHSNWPKKSPNRFRRFHVSISHFSTMITLGLQPSAVPQLQVSVMVASAISVLARGKWLKQSPNNTSVLRSLSSLVTKQPSNISEISDITQCWCTQLPGESQIQNALQMI